MTNIWKTVESRKLKVVEVSKIGEAILSVDKTFLGIVSTGASSHSVSSSGKPTLVPQDSDATIDEETPVAATPIKRAPSSLEPPKRLVKAPALSASPAQEQTPTSKKGPPLPRSTQAPDPTMTSSSSPSTPRALPAKRKRIDEPTTADEPPAKGASTKGFKKQKIHAASPEEIVKVSLVKLNATSVATELFSQEAISNKLGEEIFNDTSKIGRKK